MHGWTGPPGCLALAGEPVGSASRWAATSNVEVGQTTYRVDRGSRRGRKGSEGQSHTEEKREEGSETGQHGRPQDF